ncbi:sodium:proton antiporter [Acuticoccus sediminis]|uniref:Sodium:proton antiporter n=1 Tax=Acuticoccus sediminis TaxID=2184697 RepID=A0A8B2P241_9HYPH|nr:Na+/H+ antiporter subunit E [Acuticoccus sediminis]RAI02347.1 sodium:proton antiporter [Acuticoccus sediminis]
MTRFLKLPGKGVHVLVLAAVFLRELVVSSVAVARTVLSADAQPRSAIIAVPLDVRTDAGITTLANCVTLTPGTTALHVSEDRRTLFVHVLDTVSESEVVAGIKSTFERRIREIEA